MYDRAYYSSNITDFKSESVNEIFAKIALNYFFDINDLTKASWTEEINILKRNLDGINSGRILLEYTIPRMGKRVDGVILFHGIVFILEFKVGDKEYRKATDDQVMDYALDLKNFQKSCHDKVIIPISVATEAPDCDFEIILHKDSVAYPIRTNSNGIASVLSAVTKKYAEGDFDYLNWEHSEYMPTPTIVEAAQALYNNHNVDEITRHDSGAKNLTDTIGAIKDIILASKTERKKSIVFVTGVPLLQHYAFYWPNSDQQEFFLHREHL